MSDEFELRIGGFKTKAQAEAFYNWYEGQGEQDAAVWFEVRKDEGEIDVDFMPADVRVKPQWLGNELFVRLKI